MSINKEKWINPTYPARYGQDGWYPVLEYKKQKESGCITLISLVSLGVGLGLVIFGFIH